MESDIFIITPAIDSIYDVSSAWLLLFLSMPLINEKVETYYQASLMYKQFTAILCQAEELCSQTLRLDITFSLNIELVHLDGRQYICFGQ